MTGPALAAELTLNGEGGADDSSFTSDTSTGFSIEEASKAFRTEKPVQAVADKKPPVTQQPPDSDRPRNPDGTFAKLNADGSPIAAPKTAQPAAVPADGAVDDAPADGTELPADEPAEPKLLKLAGEPQRGEPDIELDVTDLPPEAIKRLELNEQRGMRRKEYDQAMDRLSKSEQDRVAFETTLALNPVGVVLGNMTPDRQLEVATSVILSQWDKIAPVIHTYWNDAEARMKALTDLREGTRTLSTQVQQQVAREQYIRAIGSTVDKLIPDGTDAITADEFRAAAWTRLQTSYGQRNDITLDQLLPIIPKELTTLAARYGFQDDGTVNTPAEPPKRPKLAVYNAAQSNNGASGQAGATPTVSSMSPKQFQDKLAQRQGARAVAPQGAGGGSPITRTAIPATATIEQASAALRGTTRK